MKKTLDKNKAICDSTGAMKKNQEKKVITFEEALSVVENDTEGYAFGFRGDNRILSVGDKLNPSKRFFGEDARDFPTYGTEEYTALEEERGTSAYSMDKANTLDVHMMNNRLVFDHVYLIRGNSEGSGEDEGEVLISEAEVVAEVTREETTTRLTPPAPGGTG